MATLQLILNVATILNAVGEGPDEDEMRMLGIDPGDAVAGGF